MITLFSIFCFQSLSCDSDVVPFQCVQRILKLPITDTVELLNIG